MSSAVAAVSDRVGTVCTVCDCGYSLDLSIATQDMCLPNWSPALCLIMVYSLPWVQLEFIIHAVDGKTSGLCCQLFIIFKGLVRSESRRVISKSYPNRML